MKKTLIILLCTFVLFLTACDPAPSGYLRNIPVDDVVSVELINYKNPDAKMINTLLSRSGIKSFDFKKMEIIEDLSEDKFEDFLQDFSDLDVWTRWQHPNSPIGGSLRIVYANGDFDVISCHNEEHAIISFMAKYNKKGKLKDHIGTIESKEDYINILNKYFTRQIS